jgi:methyl-accepting chemotaxis protein
LEEKMDSYSTPRGRGTGARIMAGFALVLMLVVALTVVGIGQVNKINWALSRINDVYAVKQKYAIAFRGSVHDRSIALRDAVLATPEELPRVAADIARLAREYGQAETPLDTLMADGTASQQERGIAANIKAIQAQALPLVGSTLDALARGDGAAARTSLNSARPVFVQWLAAVNQLIDLEEQQIGVQGAAARQVGVDFQRLMLGLTLAAIVLGAVLAYVIARHITRALGAEPDDLKRIAEAIRQGDLSTPIVVRDGQDDSILATLARMQDSLSRVVSGVRQHADSVSVVSEQIAQGNADLSSRTVDESNSLRQSTESMEQLTEAVKVKAESAMHGSAIAARAADTAARGSKTMNDVVGTMQQLSESSARISDITSVIEGIAFQTNILALNASVEAARAGTQGKGFAVVANEVRSLAQRADQAAKEIKTLIADSVSKVQSGVDNVSHAGKIMQEIVVSITQTTSTMNDIANDSRDQTTRIEEVSRMISHLASDTRKNTVLAEEASEAANTLREEAGAMRNAVAVFRLKGAQRLAADVAQTYPAAVFADAA